MSRPLGQHDMLSFERTDKIQSCLGISRKFAAQSSRSTVFGVGVKLVGLGTVPSVDHSLGGVVTYGALGHVTPSSFGNSVHYAAVASLTVKISKITKEIHVLNFHLSRQKQAKIHVNKRIPEQVRTGKYSC